MELQYRGRPAEEAVVAAVAQIAEPAERELRHGEVKMVVLFQYKCLLRGFASWDLE